MELTSTTGSLIWYKNLRGEGTSARQKGISGRIAAKNSSASLWKTLDLAIGM